MKLIVITDSKENKNEVEIITRLFEEGLDILHFRKPDLDIKKFEAVLKTIPSKYYNRIVVHSHYKLIEKYNLKGIHLTGKHKEIISDETITTLFKLVSKRRLTISTSMHSLEEISENKWKYDYIFLSPVFDSISKEDYKSTLDRHKLKIFISSYKSYSGIVALGGIDERNVGEISEMGFSGVALLGAIWNKENPIERFVEIKQKIKV